MKVNEILKKIVADSGFSQAVIAEKAGFKRQSNVTGILGNENMKMNSLLSILKVCGYKVVIVPERKGGESYEVE